MIYVMIIIEVVMSEGKGDGNTYEIFYEFLNKKLIK